MAGKSIVAFGYAAFGVVLLWVSSVCGTSRFPLAPCVPPQGRVARHAVPRRVRRVGAAAEQIVAPPAGGNTCFLAISSCSGNRDGYRGSGQGGRGSGGEGFCSITNDPRSETGDWDHSLRIQEDERNARASLVLVDLQTIN